MTSYPSNKYEQITPSYRLSVKYNRVLSSLHNGSNSVAFLVLRFSIWTYSFLYCFWGSWSGYTSSIVLIFQNKLQTIDKMPFDYLIVIVYKLWKPPKYQLQTSIIQWPIHKNAISWLASDDFQTENGHLGYFCKISLKIIFQKDVYLHQESCPLFSHFLKKILVCFRFFRLYYLRKISMENFKWYLKSYLIGNPKKFHFWKFIFHFALYAWSNRRTSWLTWYLLKSKRN